MKNFPLCIAALSSLFIASNALAQLSGSVSAVSDYVYRGFSLSQGNPVGQFTLNYDHGSGLYAGATGSSINMKGINADLELLTYAGYAIRLDNGWNWDSGALSSYFPRAQQLAYHELFIGLSSDSFNGKLYYSPAYFGMPIHSLYYDLNASYPLAETVSLVGHGGLLHSYSYAGAASPHAHFDLRLGVGVNLKSWNFQAAWVSAHQQTGYIMPTPHELVLSAMNSF